VPTERCEISFADPLSTPPKDLHPRARENQREPERARESKSELERARESNREPERARESQREP
jgi:hypothetical protein